MEGATSSDQNSACRLVEDENFDQRRAFFKLTAISIKSTHFFHGDFWYKTFTWWYLMGAIRNKGVPGSLVAWKGETTF